MTNTADALVREITKGIQEKKGRSIVVIDLSGIDGAIAHYFVICQGGTPTQVEAIADSVIETVRIGAGEKPSHVVGMSLCRWVAMDYGEVMVHMFVPEAREFYSLESLWSDAPMTVVPDID